MRYAEGHKEMTRERIVKAAAQALRRGGLDGVSIPALMKKVGLTHGGFYVHFADRDALVAEAVVAAGTETAKVVFGPHQSLESTVAAYVSRGHVDHPAQGCVLAALGAEAPRQAARVRRSFNDTAAGFLGLVEQKLNPESKDETVSDEALALAAKMIGAVVLGRLLKDEQLVDRLLSAARKP